MYIFIRKNGETFGVHLHTSSGQENKIKWNLKKKEMNLKRNIIEVCHLGMSSRSMNINNGILNILLLICLVIRDKKLKIVTTICK